MKERAAALAGQGRATLDAARRRSRTVDVAGRTDERDRRAVGTVLAGAVAFRLFVYLLPLFLAVLTLAGVVAGIDPDSPGKLGEHMGMSAYVIDSIESEVQQSRRSLWVLVPLSLWAIYTAGLGAAGPDRDPLVRPGRLAAALRGRGPDRAVVAVAPNRRRALIVGGGRGGRQPGGAGPGRWPCCARGTWAMPAPRALPPDAAASIVSTLLAPFRTSMRAVLVLGLDVALVAWVTGPSAVARAVRRVADRAVAAVRARLPGEREPAPVEVWIGGHKTALRLAVAAAGVLVLAFWTYPTGMVVLAVIELVATAGGITHGG